MIPTVNPANKFDRKSEKVCFDFNDFVNAENIDVLFGCANASHNWLPKTE